MVLNKAGNITQLVLSYSFFAAASIGSIANAKKILIEPKIPLWTHFQVSASFLVANNPARLL